MACGMVSSSPPAPPTAMIGPCSWHWSRPHDPRRRPRPAAVRLRDPVADGRLCLLPAGACVRERYGAGSACIGAAACSVGADAVSDLLLTRDELQALTGTKQAKRMCDWLTIHGWVFVPPTRRAETPKVSRAYSEARLSGQRPQEPAKRRVGPSVDWMTQAA